MEQGDQDARAEYSGGKREAGLKSARDVGECPGDDRSEALSGGENDRVRAVIPQDQAWEGKDRRAMDVTVVGNARKEPPKSAAEAKATAAEPETSKQLRPCGDDR